MVPRFVDIPSSGVLDPEVSESPNRLYVCANGTLIGSWEIWCISKTHVDKGTIRPLSADLYVRSQVQRALQKKPEECVILTCGTYDSQGLLVRLKVEKHKPFEAGDFVFSEYIGGVNVTPSEIRQDRERLPVALIIGYDPGMVDLGAVDWDHKIFELYRL